MAITHPAAVRTILSTAVRDAIDAGTGPGLIKIYTAGKAALLATLTCSDPCGSVASGTLTLSAVTRDSSADATGSAALFEVTDSTGALVFSGTISATGGSGDMQFPTVDFVLGQAIELSSFTYSASL
jgi:hypothetical protein